MTSLEHPRSRPVAEHEPPADLIDKLAERMCSEWNTYVERVGRSDDTVPEEWTESARTALAALSEHFPPGALIDPATWTRIRAERYENGVELCIVHDEVKVETHDPSGGCAEAWGADCETVPLYTLDPPLTREAP